MGVFDLATAFPSIDHQFLKACLAAVGLSPALRHFVDQQYMNNEQLVLHRGISPASFTASSGVLQGCPLSGAIFSLCINPLLVMLHNALQTS